MTAPVAFYTLPQQTVADACGAVFVVYDRLAEIEAIAAVAEGTAGDKITEDQLSAFLRIVRRCVGDADRAMQSIERLSLALEVRRDDEA